MASNTQTPAPQPPPSNPLALPPTLSPDTLDALSSLAADLTRVRAHLNAATTELAPSADQLSVKDFVGPSDAIKHKIQRARKAMGELPDMKRGIKEQEREVEELRGRIERQRRALGGLRGLGEGMVKGEEGDKMEM